MNFLDINHKINGMNMFNKIKLSLIAFSLISSPALAQDVFLKKDSIMCTTVENLGKIYMAAENDELDLMEWMISGKRCVVNKSRTEGVLVMDIGPTVKKIEVYSVVDGEKIPLDFWTFTEYLESRS